MYFTAYKNWMMQLQNMNPALRHSTKFKTKKMAQPLWAERGPQRLLCLHKKTLFTNLKWTI